MVVSVRMSRSEVSPLSEANQALGRQGEKAFQADFRRIMDGRVCLYAGKQAQAGDMRLDRVLTRGVESQHPGGVGGIGPGKEILLDGIYLYDKGSGRETVYNLLCPEAGGGQQQQEGRKAFFDHYFHLLCVQR